MTPTLILLLVLAFACAEGARRGTDLALCSYMLGAYSVLNAVIYMMLRAGDVGFNEICLGAITVFFFYRAIQSTQRFVSGESPNPAARVAATISLTGFAIAAHFAIADLDSFGDPNSTASLAVGLRYLMETYEANHTANVVTAIIAGFRGIDTFKETIVVFVAGIGACYVRGGIPRTSELVHQERNLPPVRVMTNVVSILFTIAAAATLAAGHHGPGGGFQAGALMALRGVIERHELGMSAVHALPTKLAMKIACAGLTVLAFLALVPVLLGGNILEYARLSPLHAEMARHWGFFVFEAGIALAVWGSFIVLFDALSADRSDRETELTPSMLSMISASSWLHRPDVVIAIICAVMDTPRAPYHLTVPLLVSGLRTLWLDPNVIKKLIGLNIFQVAMILLYVMFGYKHGAGMPILGHGGHGDPALMANGLPHGLMLTAIVVGVALTGIGLQMAVVIFQRFKTLDQAALMHILRTTTTRPRRIQEDSESDYGAWAYRSLLAVLIVWSSWCVYRLAGPDGAPYALGGWKAPLGIEFGTEGVSRFMIALVAVVATIAIFATRDLVRRELGRVIGLFYSLAGVLVLALSCLVATRDLFNAYVCFELSGLAAYALTSRGKHTAAISAFRYFWLGSVGACLYLLGVGLLFAKTGYLGMAEVAQVLASGTLDATSYIALGMMVAGLCLKAAVFPLHYYLPDTYAGASTPAAALIAPLATKAAALVLLRVTHDVFTDTPIGNLLAGMALVGIVAIAIQAFGEHDFKRLLGISSAGQICYIALAIGLGTDMALAVAVFHMGAHAFMKLGLFLAAGAFEAQGGTSEEAMAGVAAKLPIVSALTTVLSLGMLGFPLTAGFVTKLELVRAITATGWSFWIMAPAAIVVGVLGGLATLIYLGRMLKAAYLAVSQQTTESVAWRSWRLEFGMATCTVFVFALFAKPGALLIAMIL